VRVLRSQLAFILVNRDGPAIQPGSRSYARSWIRDGSLTSEALLRLGQAGIARSFLMWFAGFQAGDGRVPCCVDARGADGVPENDSHGQLLFLIAETVRHTRDRGLAARMWPNVVSAVSFLDALRQKRRTPEYETGEGRVFYGLLPESISHEGYSAKPMHSYWDGFFGLRGLKDAVFLAEFLGKADEARAFAAIRDEFAADLHASIRLVMERHGIDYLPGCAELGDFDATSTTVALAPGGEEARLPRAALERTFEKYLENLSRREAGEGDSYTPYEWRNVGALVRLGRRDEALRVAESLLRDLRPAEWNQWGEVVWRDPGPRSSSATCRTPGSAPTSPARSSTSSPDEREGRRARRRRRAPGAVGPLGARRFGEGGSARRTALSTSRLRPTARAFASASRACASSLPAASS
jgi:Glucoamylase and related glycosyl hydrolases